MFKFVAGFLWGAFLSSGWWMLVYGTLTERGGIQTLGAIIAAVATVCSVIGVAVAIIDRWDDD